MAHVPLGSNYGPFHDRVEEIGYKAEHAFTRAEIAEGRRVLGRHRLVDRAGYVSGQSQGTGNGRAVTEKGCR